MSDTKYAFPQFAFYDRTGIQAYLEKQALKGWLLEKTGTWSWRFRRDYPRKLHFAVTYFPKADLFDPEPGEQEQTFREFCAHGGWTLAASSAQMQIFYSEAEDPTPIETDPVIEVENIHKSMKKSVLPSQWGMLVLAVALLLLQCCLYGWKPLEYLSSDLNLFLIIYWIILLVLNVDLLARYYRWRKRAQTAAEEDGVFVETKDNRVLQSVICILLMVGLFGIVAAMEDKRRAVLMTLELLMTLIVVVLVVRFRDKLKREGYDAKTSKTATVIACVVLSVVISGVGNGLIGQMINNTTWPGEEEYDLPLSIEDLLGEGEYTTLVLTDQESILLGYQRIFQVNEGEDTMTSLDYDAVKVKLPSLYERCLAEVMEIPKYMEDGKYQPIDPTPWGAERAWQLHDGDELRQWYVLCYEDTILELIPDWELTAEQMATVGEIFG